MFANVGFVVKILLEGKQLSIMLYLNQRAVKILIAIIELLVINVIAKKALKFYQEIQKPNVIGMLLSEVISVK